MKRDWWSTRRRPSNVVVVAAAGVEEAPAGVSFTGAIVCASIDCRWREDRHSEDGGAVETVAASRHWLRPFSDRDRGISVGSGG
jgi:hypothetical protein